MIFVETELKGVFTIALERFEDERGFFALSWSAAEFARRGLDPCLAECNISFNKKKGTLRGMHYQETPHGQTKIVRCTMGSLYDVVIDLRAGSPTFRKWIGLELTARNHLALYVPKDFAHGFQTLEDKTEIVYQMSDPYIPGSGRGVRWNDPAFAIQWPDNAAVIISERDRTYPGFLNTDLF